MEPLLDLDHRGRTRVRMSLDAPELIRFEGGTDSLAARLHALGRLARAGYKVGLTVAPIQPLGDWRAGYRELFAMAADELGDVPGLDLTAELITHRFTPKSKAVLDGWYPGSSLDMDEASRSRKLTKFGSVKHVYPAPLMKKMRAELTGALAQALPGEGSLLDLTDALQEALRARPATPPSSGLSAACSCRQPRSLPRTAARAARRR